MSQDQIIKLKKTIVTNISKPSEFSKDGINVHGRRLNSAKITNMKQYTIAKRDYGTGTVDAEIESQMTLVMEP